MATLWQRFSLGGPGRCRGIGWITIAGLIAEIGPFHRFRHGRQLVKLAGLQPSRRESGQRTGRTPITKRGRAQLRAVVYMATLSSLRNNQRLKAHDERLTQRVVEPNMLSRERSSRTQQLGGWTRRFRSIKPLGRIGCVRRET